MADLMFVAPDRRRAEAALDFHTKPVETLWDAWEDGEPVYFYRLEHRVGRGWCIFRYVSGEQVDESPF